MLLKRKTVTDAKTGQVEDAVVIRVCGSDGHPKNVTLIGSKAERYNQLDAAFKSFGGLFPSPRKGAFDSTDPLAWNVSQLAYTEAKMLKKQRVPTIYEKVMPLSFEAPPWATSVETQAYDEIGVADLAASDSTDMPFADARFDRVVIEVKGGKIGYHYDIHELIESAQLKRPLSEMRMAAALNAYKRHMNMVALKGDTRTGQKGLWNQAGVTPVVATTGAWNYDGTSVLGIIDDITKPIATVYEATGTNDFVTDIAMPLKLLSYLASRMVTVTTGGVTIATPMTVLEYVKANNVSKLVGGIDIQFHGVPDDLKTDGTVNTAAGSSLSYAGTLKHDGNTGATVSSRTVFYAKDPERLVMHIPLPLTFLAPQPRNTDIVVPGRYRYTAPKLLFAKSMYYLDNCAYGDTAS
jgi:hypothetical protein